MAQVPEAVFRDDDLVSNRFRIEKEGYKGIGGTVRTAGDNPLHTSLMATQEHAILNLQESNFYKIK